jgi:hypothetical protein
MRALRCRYARIFGRRSVQRRAGLAEHGSVARLSDRITDPTRRRSTSQRCDPGSHTPLRELMILALVSKRSADEP